MAGKINLELKVGIFAFLALVILTLAVFSISGIYIFRPGYHIEVSFGFASGIDVGAIVSLAGVEVGKVEDIELTYNGDKGKTEILVDIWLDEKVEIPQDSYAYVGLLALIGERYLEIIPGQDYKHLLQEGDILEGRDAFSADSLMEIAHKASANLDQLLSSVNEVLDEDVKMDLKETIHNFRDFSRSLKVITERLERGEGKLGAWLVPKKSRKKKSRN